jgi:pre-rRNA-processing protein TSR3
MTSVPTTVIRHHKEKVRKCSLRFLHERPEMTFVRHRPGFTFDASGFLLLAVGAAPLSRADAGRPILLLDSSWRWLPQLAACLRGAPIARSIPGPLRTAYPRTSRLFEDPAEGLASVEALYLARRILGDDDPSLLEGYHWRQAFLAQLGALPPP